LQDPLVRHAIEVIRHREFELVLGRNVFVSWPGAVHQYPQPKVDDHLQAAMWAGAISVARQEAAAENALSALQLEIYGTNPLNELESRPVVGTERERIQGAIAEAVDLQGPVDFVRPGVWDRNPAKYYCAMGGLGRTVIEHHTYSVKPPDWDVPAPTRPTQGRWLWGTNVVRVGFNEAMSWTLDGKPEGCIGQDIYIPHAQFAAVLLGEDE
jgi:hypothetical protein